MIANRVLHVILGMTSLVVIPVQIVTTLVLGLAVSLTLGLLLLPISLIWATLLAPMLFFSWICSRVPALRDALGIILIPWVVVSDIFISLMPSMGEMESRAAKLMLCDLWPYSWECWQFQSGRLDLESSDPAIVAFSEILHRRAIRDPLKQRVIMRISSGQRLDPDTSETTSNLETLGANDPRLDEEEQSLRKEIAQLKEILKLKNDLDTLEDPKTIFAFGMMSYEGDGVPQDYATALNWYRIAAEQGHAKAQHNLALMHDEGQGVPQDYGEAAKWYRMAAEQGNPGSQNNLGRLFATGQGVTQDYGEAADWYRKAASNGDSNALENLRQLELKVSRQKYEKIVFDLLDFMPGNISLIGDCASLPHSKNVLLYAMQWMKMEYEEKAEADTDPEIRKINEAMIPNLCMLITLLACDWHVIDDEDRDAVTRLNRCESFPTWAADLKRKYIDDDEASRAAFDAAHQVMVDRVQATGSTQAGGPTA